MKRTPIKVILSILVVILMTFSLMSCNGKDGLNGKSAYQLAVENGYTGSLEEWLESFNGKDGEAGKSAYELAVEGGYIGTVEEWLKSLAGAPGTNGESGKSAYQLAVEGGYTGTLEEWLATLVGDNGLSAYEIYKKYHPSYTGTEQEWLESLKGEPGTAGVSIVNAYVDSDFHLWIQLSNGSNIDAGYVGVSTSGRHTVTFVDYDNREISKVTVNHGEAATAPTAPTRNGYDFIGWDTEFDEVTADITVKALYEESVSQCTSHTDENNDGKCDSCTASVVIVFDIYALNDLHGKFNDTSTSVGVDELSTYLENAYSQNSATVVLSSGDMWQGSAESNLTKGAIITDWMNEMDFASMTVGNHEFDWGAEYIDANADIADFAVLAINLYDSTTGERADFCEASVIVERNGVKVGIIGAIGDCKSSISSSLVENYEFKVGNELTSLVKAESQRLRSLGCELIIYSLHDGYGYSSSGVTYPSSSDMSSYYDVALSDGYVDVVFEGHSHQSYVHVDTNGVYHLQNGGYNDGISHVELSVNIVRDTVDVELAEIVESDEYANLEDHSVVDELLEKYEDEIAIAMEELGFNPQLRDSTFIRQLVAELYLVRGLEKWGDDYDIVLGGGYISTRDPYVLPVGTLLYYDLMSVLPFDNAVYLCSISGAKLKSQFINTTNSNYFISYSSYGVSVSNQIDDSATYYVITDKYSVDYAPNGLTAIECLSESVFARDLLADYVKGGNLGTVPEELTLLQAVEKGEQMSHGSSTSELYFVEGEITEISNGQYGNCYIRDTQGNQIYIYGLYDTYGNRYDAMQNPPKVGDKIRVLSTVGKHNSGPQLKNAIVLSISN